jgi:hypothetical protein
MKIGGMGEQAIRVYPDELRRLNELPEDVRIVGVLPELPARAETGTIDFGPGRGPRPVAISDYMQQLPAEWVPHPKRSTTEPRCLYIHVRHRFCFRGTEYGAPLTIEGLDDFLKRYWQLDCEEMQYRGVKVADRFGDSAQHVWVDE